MRSSSEMVSPSNQLQRKQQKIVHDYSQKSVDNFKLIIENPSPKLTNQENRSIATSFGYSFLYQCIETNKNILKELE